MHVSKLNSPNNYTTHTMDYSKIQEYMSTSQPHMAIELLQKHLTSSPDNLLSLQLLGEALLEIGEPEQAYTHIIKAAQIDPQGTQGGYEKFLWLGQLIGGKQGIEWYNKGIEGLKNDIVNDEQQLAQDALNQDSEQTKQILAYKKRKLCETLCGIVEIWMTDLCMEEEAESQCVNLMEEAIKTNSEHAESWAVLASVRISQQKNEEAKEALAKAWEIFAQEEDPSLPSIMQLTKMLIEMGMLEQALEASVRIHDLNDEEIEGFYLAGLASFTAWEQNKEDLTHAMAAASAFQRASKLYEKQTKQFGEASADPEVVQHIQEMFAKLPEGLEIEEDNQKEEYDDSWEKEIVYDE